MRRSVAHLALLTTLACTLPALSACTTCEDKTDVNGHPYQDCHTYYPSAAIPNLDYPPKAAVALVPRDPSAPAPDIMYPAGTLELDGSESSGMIGVYTWAIERADGARATAIEAGCTESADHRHLVCELPDYGGAESPVGAYVAKLTVTRADGRDPSTATQPFHIAERSRAPGGVAGVRADFTVCAVGEPTRCCTDDPSATPVIRQGEDVVFASTSVPEGNLDFVWSVTELDRDGLAVSVDLRQYRDYGFYTVPVTHAGSGVIVPWTLMVTEHGTGTRHLTTKVCVFGPSAVQPPPPPPPPPPPAADPTFFVTALETNAAFGGLSGADALCQAAANGSSVLPATSKSKVWRAFLSLTPTWQGSPPAPVGPWVHAKDRIGAGPWTDLAGQVVASDVAALITNGVPRAAMLDEEGRSMASSPRVWTGTLPTGLSETEQENDFLRFGFNAGACLGWTSSNPFAHATTGCWDGSGSWVDTSLLGCEQLAHLYCFAE